MRFKRLTLFYVQPVIQPEGAKRASGPLLTKSLRNFNPNAKLQAFKHVLNLICEEGGRVLEGAEDLLFLLAFKC